MELIEELTYDAMLKPPLVVGDGPFGTRMFFDVIEGTMQGPRIRGRFVGAAATGPWSGPTATPASMYEARSKPTTEP